MTNLKSILTFITNLDRQPQQSALGQATTCQTYSSVASGASAATGASSNGFAC